MSKLVNSQTFRMKPLVFTRLLAEVTVAFLVLLLPLAIWFLPQLQQLAPTLKAIGYVMSIGALFLLPLYGFTTVEVVVDDKQITTISLLKRHSCLWTDIQKLQLKTDWGWRRYVVEYEGGELTFPAMLYKIDELLQIIRQHMPQVKTKGGGPRLFHQGAQAVAWQYVQLVLGLAFACLLWWFFATTGISKSTQFADMTLILFVCMVFTGILIWRAFTIITMALSIEVLPAELKVKTWLGEHNIAWKDVAELKPALPILPDGMMLKTNRGGFLLSDNLSDADELKGAITNRLGTKL